MAVKFTNNAATTLAAGINSSVTSIAVTDGSVFPTITGSDHFYVTFDDTTNKEIVKVTARSGNTLTVVRGHDNTTARAFSSGDKAELRIVAALLDDVKTDVSSTLTVDTFTGDGSTTAFTLSVAPASEDNLIVFIEGVYQNPGDFTLSGTTLTLDVAPANSRKIIVYHVAALVSGNNLTHNQFTCNGSTTAFTLGLSPIHENNTQVFLDGVYQQKTDYAVSGTTLTMDTAPANGAILEVMTFTQTEVNTLPASFVSGLTQVTAVGADHFMIFDATDSALKKSLVSDVLESATSISTSADATAITIDSSENVTFTAAVTTGTTLSIGGNNNELRFYEGSNYVGFEAPALSADKIWVLPAADGTSGQVLTTDGSGTLSFSTISETTINNNADNRIITGSGTANTLNGESGLTYDGSTLAVTGDANFDSNTLFVDASANNVGIGTTSPTDKLDVAAPNSQFRLTDTDDSTFTQFSSSGGKLAIRQDSTSADHVFLNASGNVGIGTSSPDQLLQVGSESYGANAIIKTQVDGSDVGNFDSGLHMRSHDDNFGGSIVLESRSGTNDIVNFKYHNNSSAGATAMAIDATNGNVGIGTSSPDADLSLLSPVYTSGGTGNGVRFQNQNNNADAIIQSYYSGTSPSALLSGANAYLSTAAAFTSFDSAKASSYVLQNTNGNIEFGNAASGNPTTKMLLNSSGNVGIGTTSPTDKLDVAAPNSQFRLTDTDDSTFTQFSSSGGKLAIRQDSTSADHVFLNASGNVGIGTSSPTTQVTASQSANISQVAITSSSNAVAWNATAAANAYHVTTENTTFAAPTNPVEGAIISVEIAQGGTARTVAWNTVFEFAASTAPTVTATANKTDIFSFRYNGSVWQEIGRVQNMAQT